MASADDTKDNSFSMRFVIKTLKGKWPTVPLMDTSTLYTWLYGAASDVKEPGSLLLLDTRPEEEFIVSHIPGSRRVDPDSADIQETMQLLQQNKQEQTVVCYCALGYRSSKYAQAIATEIEKDGGTDLKKKVGVYNLEGSIFKWANEGKPMVDHRDRPTVYAHPFSVVWGKVLNKRLRRHQPEN